MNRKLRRIQFPWLAGSKKRRQNLNCHIERRGRSYLPSANTDAIIIANEAYFSAQVCTLAST
jgi:hypothetical protein